MDKRIEVDLYNSLDKVYPGSDLHNLYCLIISKGCKAASKKYKIKK